MLLRRADSWRRNVVEDRRQPALDFGDHHSLTLRVVGNLTAPDGKLAPPETVARVGIGSRVRMVFSDVAPGLSLPQWTLDEGATQPAKPWRYPQE